MSICKFIEMSYEEIGALNKYKSVLFLPISPIEEHGPHLPVGTDVYAAKDIMDYSIEKLDIVDSSYIYIKLPALTLGATGITQNFPGSINIRGKHLKNILIDYFKSLAICGFKYLVISNHHLDLEHVKAIDKAIVYIEKRYDIKIYDIASRIIFSNNHDFDYTPENIDNKFEIHADIKETSFMLYKYPDLVKDCVNTLPSVKIDIEEKFRKGIKCFKKMGALKGYIGSPAESSAEIGKNHYEIGAQLICDHTINLLRGMDKVEFSKDMKFVMRFFTRL